MQAKLDHIHDVLGVADGKVGDPALAYTFEKLIHVICLEGWLQGTHLIEDASQAPDITLVVVRLILPYLRACIVWCSSLSLKKTAFCNFADVEIA